MLRDNWILWIWPLISCRASSRPHRSIWGSTCGSYSNWFLCWTLSIQTTQFILYIRKLSGVYLIILKLRSLNRWNSAGVRHSILWADTRSILSFVRIQVNRGLCIRWRSSYSSFIQAVFPPWRDAPLLIKIESGQVLNPWGSSKHLLFVFIASVLVSQLLSPSFEILFV